MCAAFSLAFLNFVQQRLTRTKVLMPATSYAQTLAASLKKIQPLDKDLETLINALEEEKINLRRLIDSSVKDQEFLFAHFHFEALGQVNSQLQTLRNLEDELYDEKNSKLMGIENLKRGLERETSDRFREYMSRMIEANQKELQRLNEIPKTHKQESGDHVLDRHIELLLKRKLRVFRMILIKNYNLILEIKRIKGTIRITLPYVKRLIRNCILSDERINKFKGLGFQFTDKGEKLIKTLTGDTDELRSRLRTLLAIICFEIFYFKEFDRETYIEI